MTDHELVTYALLHAAAADPANDWRYQAAVNDIELMPDGSFLTEDARAALPAAIATLKRAHDDLPALIARLQTLADRPAASLFDADQTPVTSDQETSP
jgi:hypothetical protein